MRPRRIDGQSQLWLRIAAQPAVVEVLAALAAEAAPVTFTDLCARVGTSRVSDTTAAVRCLGASGLLDRLCSEGGTWDGCVEPDTRFELTSRGQDFARALGDLGRWVAKNHEALTAGPFRP